MPSPELYKDKVEVSLDGRQIFYLFFGGAVLVGIVFVLGVLVGRRVEARGHIDRARTAAATDPLAALDRLEGNGGMAFRGALTGHTAVAPVEKKIDAIAADKAKKPADEANKPAEKKVEPANKPAAPPASVAKTEPKTESKTENKDEKTAEKKDVKIGEKKDEKKDEKIGEKKDEKKGEKKDEPKAETKAEDKSRYTLQLSSFQDKSEAEAFLANVKAQGYQAQITQAEVEGKGTFYRVRMGTYRSLESATSAKSEFEKSSTKSASIMKL